MSKCNLAHHHTCPAFCPRYFRDREPVVLQGKHFHVLRRCQGQHRSAGAGNL